MSRLLKVGFEVEGGWNGTPRISPFPDIPLVADHSVNGQTLLGAHPLQATHVGEAVSPPLLVSEPKVWEEWLTSHWPNADPKDRTNRTCGFHIHISLKSKRDYTLLGAKSFLYTLQEAMLSHGKKMKLPKKHVFWERMHGYNKFCTLDFDPAQQMKVTKKGGANRYGWLNFAWAMHGTMEFRALPTFRDAKVAISFVNLYLSTIEEWLEANQKTSLKRSARLVE